MQAHCTPYGLLLKGLFVSGCIIRPAPADPKAFNNPVCERLVNSRLVTVEVIHVNGVKAPGRSVEKAIKGFSKYVAGEVRTAESEPVELQVDENGLVRREQLDAIIAGSLYYLAYTRAVWVGIPRPLRSEYGRQPCDSDFGKGD